MANLPSPIRLIRQLVPALAGASLILSTESDPISLDTELA